MATTKTRIQANRTELVEEAVEHAPEALGLEGDASATRRATAWIEYGYNRWLAEQRYAEKVQAYRELAEDRERLEIIDRSSQEAVKAGIW